MSHAGYWGRKGTNGLTQSWILKSMRPTWQARFTHLCNSSTIAVGVIDSSLNLRSSLQKGTHDSYYKHGQNWMAEEILGPSGNWILLLRYMDIMPSFLLNIYANIHTQILLSDLIKGLSSKRWWMLRHTGSDGVFSPKEDICTIPF